MKLLLHTYTLSFFFGDLCKLNSFIAKKVESLYFMMPFAIYNNFKTLVDISIL